jgi:hypothetical protein
MNLLAEFLHYAQKVFGFKGVARGVELSLGSDA